MQAEEIVYTEPVEVPVLVNIQKLSFAIQYTNIEAGFVTGIRTYSASEVPFAPSGLAVVPSTLLAAAYLTLADTEDEKWTNIALKDFNLYQQTNVVNKVPNFQVRLSGKSFVFIADPTLIAANVGKVFLFQFMYKRRTK